eukprot:Skav224478  [mRNA]  locus=scaffold1302:721710:725191:- [translate_table: standard]
MATWNVRGKSLPQIADVLSDQRIHFDALALQEVGSLAQGTPEPDGFLHLDDAQVQFHPFLSQYWIVCTDQLNSHLGQALLIDRSYADSIVTTLKGHRFIGAQFVHTGGSKMWLFSGHLPHHQLPLSEYTEAIHELQRFLDKAHNIPCIIGADWNATPTGDNLDAQGLELACLIAANQLHPLMPPVPTWKHKFYDFFIASPAFINLVAEEAMPLRAPEVAPHLDNLLPTDHKLVTLDTVLAPGTCRHRGPRRHNRAGRWLVDNNSLTTIVEQSTAPLTHVVREWIIHASATRGWLAECLRRYWSFLGHICRQDFCPPHPSRIMLTHLATRHTGGLNRPGPWHTAHSLIRKFWSECGIDHDYLYYAQDRDAWRDLGRRFLCWMGQPESITNTELLPTNPWESKGQLLRQQAQWLHTAVLTVQVDTILIAWLATRDGPSKLSTPLHSPTTASTILDGFLQLEGHLRMAYQPFVQQLAISQHHIWQLLLEQEPCCHQCLLKGRASWYQLFPIQASLVAHPVLQQFIQ